VASQKEERIQKGQINGKKTVIIQVDEDFPNLIFQPWIHGTLKFSIHCPKAPGRTPGF